MEALHDEAKVDVDTLVWRLCSIRPSIETCNEAWLTSMWGARLEVLLNEA